MIPQDHCGWEPKRRYGSESEIFNIFVWDFLHEVQIYLLMAKQLCGDSHPEKNNPQINKMIPQVDKVGFWLVLTHLSADYTLLKLIAGVLWLYVS